MIVKLLTKHHLEFLNLKGGYTCSSESKLIKNHIVGNHTSRLKSDLGLIIFAKVINRRQMN